MDHPSFSLDHRLREIHSAAADLRRSPRTEPGTSVVSALRDRLGRSLVAAGEALQTSHARSVRAA